ncbi:hypothetical protein D3C72_2588720 [compost metagenome]
MTAEGIGFAGESALLQGNALLMTGIQLSYQQLTLQRFYDGREDGLQLVDGLRSPISY